MAGRVRLRRASAWCKCIVLLGLRKVLSSSQAVTAGDSWPRLLRRLFFSVLEDDSRSTVAATPGAACVCRGQAVGEAYGSQLGLGMISPRAALSWLDGGPRDAAGEPRHTARAPHVRECSSRHGFRREPRRVLPFPIASADLETIKNFISRSFYLRITQTSRTFSF